jgi:hypothetical protein
VRRVRSIKTEDSIQTHRLYARLTTTKVRCQLIAQKGYRENVVVDNDPVVVRISIDAKATVKVGNFSFRDNAIAVKLLSTSKNRQRKKHLKPLLWRLEMHRGFKYFTRHAEGETR